MTASRATFVARTLLGLLGGEVLRTVGPGSRSTDPIGGLEDMPVDGNPQRARAIRRTLEELGPLYVKMGQMLSTRPDLVPEYMMVELANLHDRVSPAPFAEFEPVLAEELGDDWRRYFTHVDTEPVGTASLAQVYRVTLKDGRPAVVKVQRPQIQRQVLEDMRLLSRLVHRVARMAPDFNDVIDLEATLEVVFSAMRPELDFTIEAENMEAFRDRIADFDRLRIPGVILVTPRVLVEECADGVSIHDFNRDRLSAKVRAEIGEEILQLMFWGFFVDRQFHADPHPGNIFVSEDGYATLIDWGMVGRLDRNLSASLAVILLAIEMNDGTGLGRAWIEMGRATRRADVAGFLNDMHRFVPGIAGQSLERLNFGEQLTTILKYSSHRGIATSPMVATLGKAFANAEGSIRHLAPHLSAIEVFAVEFRRIAQVLVQEMLSPEYAARSAAQAVLTSWNGPAQARAVLADMANRSTTIRLGEDMSVRSRHQDRVDTRFRRLERSMYVLAATAGWFATRHRRT